ncbi:DUF397 domain-containing protein [Streptomyces sp. NPDC056943]|uniref:DUF397 domain-containing protein n=1 Tax=Streptomyces sp. NPDC056943 TaxID=3345971 RepID=UPI00362A98A6
MLARRRRLWHCIFHDRRSSTGGPCIEVAAHPTTIHLRDSKNPNSPRFAVTPATWEAFVSYAAEES